MVFKEQDGNFFWQRKNVWEERILREPHSKKRLAGEKKYWCLLTSHWGHCVSFVPFRERCSWEWVSFAKGAQSLQAYCPLPKPGSGCILQRERGSRSPGGCSVVSPGRWALNLSASTNGPGSRPALPAGPQPCSAAFQLLKHLAALF